MAWYWWVIIGLTVVWLLISLASHMLVKLREEALLEEFHKEFGPQAINCDKSKEG